MREVRNLIVVLTLCVSFAALPASAIAAESSLQGYGDVGGQIQSGTDPGVSSTGNDPVVRSSSGSGSLPFTGVDLLAVLGAGILLTGIGIGLRIVIRTGRQPQSP